MVVRRNDAVTLADVDEIDPDGIFAGLPEHSFAHQSLLSAETEPFRPESILTGEGKQLIANFLERDAAVTPDPAPDGGAD